MIETCREFVVFFFTIVNMEKLQADLTPFSIEKACTLHLTSVFIVYTLIGNYSNEPIRAQEF